MMDVIGAAASATREDAAASEGAGRRGRGAPKPKPPWIIGSV